MDFFSGSNDLGTLGLGLLIAGAAAGLLAGVLGRGAVWIVVPALFFAAREAGVTVSTAMALAIGTGFAAVLPVSAAALAAKAKLLDQAWAKRWRLAVAVGLAVALVLILRLPGPVLVAGFAGAALAAAVFTALNKTAALDGVNAALIAVIATAGGAATAMVTGWDVHGLPQHSYGYVNLPAFAVTAPAVFGAWLIGRRYGQAIDAKRLRLLYALLVALSAVKMVWDVVG